MSRRGRLHIAGYYGIEAASAFGCVLFGLTLFFWTTQKYHFTDSENLALGATGALCYVVSAIAGGRLADWLGYDRVLSIGLLGMALTLLVGWIPAWHYTPFAVNGLYGLFIGPTWPAIEALLLHSRSDMSMPSRLGLFNLTWAVGDAVGYFAGGAVLAWQPDAILWVPGILHLGQFLWHQISRSESPCSEGSIAMDIPHTGDSLPRWRLRQFMWTAWLGNAAVFALLGSFFPLTPALARRFALSPASCIWFTCTTMVVRIVVFYVVLKWEGWHYRWGWMHAALWTGPGGIALAFFAPSLALVFVGLVLFGIAVGLAYSASLYYTMSCGETKGEHGGLHEGILGIGSFAGPVVGALACRSLGTTAAQWAIVLLPLAAMGIGLPWIIVRSRRSAGG